jgi:hypothetical protein
VAKMSLKQNISFIKYETRELLWRKINTTIVFRRAKTSYIEPPP